MSQFDLFQQKNQRLQADLDYIQQKNDQIRKDLEQITSSKAFKLWQWIVYFKKLLSSIPKKKFELKIPILAKREIGSAEYLSRQFFQAYQKSEKFISYAELPPASNKNEVKLIAFYLPQFYPFAENDKFWGKGFTEWRNVTRAVPLFPDHYQPRLPGDLGYYDLRIRNNLREQIRIAKNYGLYGFCLHHYWFSGKSIMRTPLNHLLADRTLDIPFCLHWANEPLTARWDGFDNKGVLIAQKHTPKDDLAFIKDIEPALKDPRYIKISGRPLLLIYRPGLFPDMTSTIERWNNFCVSHGIGKLFLAVMQTGFEGMVDPRQCGFDAAVEFPPSNNLGENITKTKKIFYPEFTGNIFRYDDIVKKSSFKPAPPYTWFRGVIPDFDVTARRMDSDILVGSTPAIYQNWLTTQCDYTARNLPAQEKFLFINAWNEWAEGAYLEPDQKYGYAYLQATYNAINEGNTHKIIICCHDGYLHGAQINILHAGKILKDTFKYDIIFLFKRGGPLIPEFKKYGQVYVLDIEYPQEKNINSLLDQLVTQGYQIAIANTTVTGNLVRLLAQRKIKTISLVHELPVLIKDYHLESGALDLAKFAEKVVFPTKLSQNSFNTIAKVNDKKAIILPQGLYKKNRYKNEVEISRKKIRTILKIPQTAKIVLNVAYADYRKGFDLFIEIASRVIQKDNEIHFVWVGKRDDSLVEKTMNSLSEITSRNIHLRDFDPAVDMFYAGADLFLLTSREDPFPAVVLEAMDVGLPVVGFKNAGGFSELISKKSGRLVPFENTKSAAEAVTKILGDKKLLKTVRDYSPKLIATKYNYTDYIYRLLDLLGHQYNKVSVIVPNYNHKKFLTKRLDSIFSQTYPIYEILFLDDNSSDGSAKLAAAALEKFAIQSRQLVNVGTSQGTYKQWLRGITASNGEYVWIAESDDYCEPTFLEKIMPSFVNDRGVVLSYSQSNQIDKNGNILHPNYFNWTDDIDTKKWKKDYINDGKNEISETLAVKNTIPNVSGVVFKKRSVAQIKSELVKFKVAGDYFFYVWLLSKGKISFTSQSLNYHRRHLKSVTSTIDRNRHYDEVVTVQDYILKHFQVSKKTQKMVLKYRDGLYKYLGLDSAERRYAR